MWKYKMRAWGGLVPLSDRRWREKRLGQCSANDPTGVPNLGKALDHLDKTSTAFMYFHIPAVHEVDLAEEELGPKMGCFTTVGMIGLEMRGLLGVVGA